jgi:uncharacterized repeat protein (TIGR03803 family)
MPLTERQLIEQQPRRYHPPEYKVLFSFGSNVHGLYGAYPIAPLVYVNGTFYGTTEYGGTYGYGTVFGLSPTGQESVLYSFSPGADGAYPAAGLVYMHGRLYGTAQYGGSYGSGNYYHGYGVVFSITTKGEEHVLHSFGGGYDGAQPMAGLTAVGNTLYGTTFYGGQYRRGTVFSVSTSGRERVLHSFQDYDGILPRAGVINVNGVLYGTTLEGGSREHYNGGTVFKITTSGSETVVYTFGTKYGGGLEPESSLVALNGLLYGTTIAGGAYGHGTAFSISKASGQETVLHSFGYNSADGTSPAAGLIFLKGKFYGTTSGGGSDGAGIVFSLTKDGTEDELHQFGVGYSNDGGAPMANFIDVKGTLYSTTAYGGINLPSCPYSGDNCAYGTIFALQP